MHTIKSERQWLSSVPWESVVNLNKSLCQAQKMESLTSRSLEAARRFWEGATGRKMALLEAFETCHQARAIAPFTFNNGNTFAAIGRALVEDYLKTIPLLEAQILRTTIGHYIAGTVDRKELQDVLEHIGPMLKSPAADAPSTSMPALMSRAQEQGASA